MGLHKCVNLFFLKKNLFKMIALKHFKFLHSFLDIKASTWFALKFVSLFFLKKRSFLK